ncbi:MAG: hypothetical protein RLZZ157_921 [Pseudomonadota bacterium]
MRHTLLGTCLLASLLLTACETIPYEERVKAYEDGIAARFIGKSSDDLVLALGPPQSTYKLSDGREVLQYTNNLTFQSGGGSYTRYETVTRTRQVRDASGVTREVAESQQIPVQQIDPIQTTVRTCTRRFVITSDKRVADFKWEGNACF